jgi:hypothetical protein
MLVTPGSQSMSAKTATGMPRRAILIVRPWSALATRFALPVLVADAELSRLICCDRGLGDVAAPLTARPGGQPSRMRRAGFGGGRVRCWVLNGPRPPLRGLNANQDVGEWRPYFASAAARAGPALSRCAA